tara:strand:+ start:23101 stop:24858 length:1758 start_codon:yes stop_codon:yes gene_type:complete
MLNPSLPLKILAVHSALIVLAGIIPLSVSATEPLQIVATGGRIGVYPYGSSDPNLTAFWHRTPHKLGGPVSEIQIGFMNWMLNYSKEQNNSNEVTIDHAWIERELDGQIIPITFDGSRTFIMPDDSVEPYWLADSVDSADWTNGPPEKDEVLWIHVKGNYPSLGRTIQGCPTGYPGSKFIVYDPANDTGAVDIAGSVHSIEGQNARTRGLPLLIVGRYSEPGHLAVIGIGDSILDGSGDASSKYSNIPGFGFFNRAAVDENGENTISMFNLTRHGATAAGWANHVRQPHFLQFANTVVEEYGTNDLGQNGTGSPSQIIERLEYIWELCREAGVQYILRTELLPRTSSSDAWSTAENQTPNPGWGPSGARDEINSAFYQAVTNSSIHSVVETLAPVSSPSDSHLWSTNGQSKYVTGDGTHLNSNGNTILAETLRASLLAIDLGSPPSTYASWQDSIDWAGQDSRPTADPNHDGINNALAYALDLSPMGSSEPGHRPYLLYLPESDGGPCIQFVFRKNSHAKDVTYEYLRSYTLMNDWEPVTVNGQNVIETTIDPDPDGDSTASLIAVRIFSFDTETPQFLKLRVNL